MVFSWTSLLDSFIHLLLNLELRTVNVEEVFPLVIFDDVSDFEDTP